MSWESLHASPVPAVDLFSLVAKFRLVPQPSSLILFCHICSLTPTTRLWVPVPRMLTVYSGPDRNDSTKISWPGYLDFRFWTAVSNPAMSFTLLKSSMPLDEPSLTGLRKTGKDSADVWISEELLGKTLPIESKKNGAVGIR